MKLIYFVIVLLFYCFAEGQNMCLNGGFESGPWDTDEWTSINETNELRFSTANGGIATILDYFENILGYNANQTTLINLSAPANYFGSQMPSESNAYMGLWTFDVGDASSHPDRDAQIFCQLSSSMLSSEKYVVQFDLSKMDYADKDPKFSVILSTDITNNGNPSGHEKVIYRGQCTNTEDWQTVHLEVEADEDYKYIFIRCYKYEILVLGNPYLAGFYVDNVIVMHKCDFDGYSCYTTSGHFSPSFNNTATSNGAAFNISNISNATAANLRIEPAGSPNQEYVNITFHSCSGLTNPIYWSGGKSVENGIVPASAGSYQVILELFNWCYHETFTTNIIKLDNWFAEDAQWYNYPSVCSLSDILIPGCQPYIYVDRSFFSGENITFQASNTVRTANDVHVFSNANLSLFAPNEIVLSDGFEALEGSEFQARIDFTTVGNKSSEPEMSVDTIADLSILENNNFDISVYPNPASSHFLIEFYYEINGNVKILLVDNTGREVANIFEGLLYSGFHQFQVSTSALSSGVYYLSFQSDKRYNCKRVVVK